MSGTDLVPITGDLDATNVEALERLAAQAEEAGSADEANEIRLKARMLSSLLEQAKRPYEEAWLAGKASVLAARRLGVILESVPNKPGKKDSPGGGAGPSDRARLADELGLSKQTKSLLLGLGRCPDDVFQRYIQSRDRIPSISGALVAAGLKSRYQSGGNTHTKLRRKHGVKQPKNPNLDEAYSLIVRALGHLSGVKKNGSGGGSRGTAISRAMADLYDAEDALKPYRGGYTK